jgi:hypothetical protein
MQTVWGFFDFNLFGNLPLSQIYIPLDRQTASIFVNFTPNILICSVVFYKP